MKNLFEPETVDEVISRVEALATLDTPLGKDGRGANDGSLCGGTGYGFGKLILQRVLIGRLIGPFFRPIYTNEKRFAQNYPTDKKLLIADERDFSREKERLKGCIQAFHDGGEAECTQSPHPFFGNLSPGDWSRGMYKHLDHHLRQFGA